VIQVDDPETIRGTEKLKGLDGWDSMAVVSFLGGVDEKFGVLIQPDDLARCVTVDDLLSLADQPK
jgi:acyl carrier protein